MKTVIIGGVAGGMSAATRLRRLDESAEIVVLERSGHVSYANCGLPYHLGGVIAERDALLLQTPASLRERFALDVRVRHEVIGIDAAARTVTVRDLASGAVYAETYDHLVLSPGAAPFVPDVPGVKRARTLRTVEDLDALVGALAAEPRTAVVVGGGFVGLETAENLRRRGLDVTVVELADQVLAPLDAELAALVHAELRRGGVALELGTALAAVHDDTVELTDGRRLAADLVVLAIGVRPDVALAREAGLAIGPRGGIAVDEHMRTSDPRIFAVGDAAEKMDAVAGGPVLVPLANAANRAGRQVADVIAGRPVRLAPSLGTAIVKVFGLTVAVTGWNEKRARAAGRDHRVIHTHPASHAGYYPGAAPMALKLVFDPGSGEILGAQAVGTEGVDKRVDVIATAMRAGLTAPELADLELAYAPPFGSAKDPVNMLGYVAANLMDGTTQSVQWHELEAAVAAGAHLVDVRTAGEYAAGHIPGALNVPLDGLRERVGELPAGSLVVYCGVGVRAHTATRLLTGLGRRAANLDGGYTTWKAATAA
ncbi:FAD-dependent oxidoreductase [Planomonospora sp. ID82291]|uniref:FAD-dependent oxidoreductase n=1 Tax=Planomonospora sp. ID82291 TaxID=2738136 RepID=UPI0018C3A740|nr:FAD-dependent oxidoreductase [Planomonospora sp. ID82291]MBG0816669.1 FAD-dependent oxidoreductase [Planomonospora sp. ID82291]